MQTGHFTQCLAQSKCSGKGSWQLLYEIEWEIKSKGKQNVKIQEISIKTDLEKALRVHPDLPPSSEKQFSNFGYSRIYLLFKESVPKSNSLPFCSHISSVYIILN